MFGWQLGTDAVTFGGRALSEFGAKIQVWPEITPCELVTGVFQGEGRSTIHPLQNRRGVRYMTALIDFHGASSVRTANQSAFDALFLQGIVEIDIGDGYLYSAVLVSESAPVADHDVYATVEYKWQVVRHWSERVLTVHTTETATPAEVYCQSNFPQTDCRIRIPFDAALGAVSGLQVVLGDNAWYYDGQPTQDLVFDGIRCCFFHGNLPASTKVTWQEFPCLVPGPNTLELWVPTEAAAARFAHDVEITYSPTFL